MPGHPSATLPIEVSVIVVTYNSAGCIEACIASVERQEGVQAEVLVVDNNSSDNTVQVLKALGAPVRLLLNQQNIGFGSACNQAFQQSRGRFIFFLNPDAQLDQPDALRRLCQAMDVHSQWGLAGTRVLSPNGQDEAAPAHHYPSQRQCSPDFAQLPGKIAWVFGASMIVRREIFAAVHGFDPGFFLTSEETDLCLRIRQHGWEIGFIEDVTVRHIGFASERGNDPYETWRRRVPGIFRFWSKHYPADYARRLVWKDWVRASFRQHWYGVMALFGGTGSSAWRKHRQYAGISDASRQFLRGAGDGIGPESHPTQTEKAS